MSISALSAASDCYDAVRKGLADAAGFEQLSNAGNHGDDALAGLTLIGDDAVKLSTLCNIAAGLSVDDAMALLNDTDVEAIFVTRGEQVACTDGLSKRPSKRMAA